MNYASIHLHDAHAAIYAWQYACSTSDAALPAHVASILLETGDIVRAAVEGCAACALEHEEQRDPGPWPRGLDISLRPGHPPDLVWRTEHNTITLRRTSGASRHVGDAWRLTVESTAPLAESVRLPAALAGAWLWRSRHVTGRDLWLGGAPNAYATAGDFDARAILDAASAIGMTEAALEAAVVETISEEERSAAAVRPAWTVAHDGPHTGYLPELRTYAERNPPPACMADLLASDEHPPIVLAEVEGAMCAAWLLAATDAITGGVDVLPIGAVRR